MSAVMVWSDLRDKAVQAFRSFPSARDEQQLLEAFQRAPVAVAAALSKVSGRFEAGKITAPWRIWVLEVTSRGDVSVDVGPEKHARQTRAEQWIKQAGAHLDRWDEMRDELFGDRGVLRDWPDLEDGIRDQWEAAKPASERAERDQEERLAATCEAQAKMGRPWALWDGVIRAGADAADAARDAARDADREWQILEERQT